MSLGAILFLGFFAYITLDTINTIKEKYDEKGRK